MKFTKEQERAINIRNADVLVSAGAGSGKTAVLVERIIRMVTDKPPINIDRLLVLTFTDAAATQMRQRIGAALNKSVKQNPGDENLREQLMRLGKANITTIHSFCLKTARRFFHKIDMDPGFRVADEAEIELMKAELLDNLFEEYYQNYYEQEINFEFIQLADIFDRRASDDNFRKLILQLHEFSRSCPKPEEWLRAAANEYKLDNGIEGTKWYDFFAEDTNYTLCSITEKLVEAIKLSNNPNIHLKYTEVLRQDLENLEALQAALKAGFVPFANALNFSFGQLPGAKSKEADGKMSKEEIDALKERIKALRGAYKSEIETLRSGCFKDVAAMEADLRKNQSNISTLAKVVLEFSRRYQELKREKNLADFADFEHFCLQILFDADGALSAEAMAIQTEFDEVFIDEYQDVSLIQEIILSTISAGSNINRLMVGDAKQCIYQFRNARPEIFSEKMRQLGDGVESGEIVSLAENFRSRQGIINGINFLFRRLMSEKVGGVSYDRVAELRHAAEYKEVLGEDLRIGMYVIESSDGENETESGEEFENDAALSELTGAEIEARVVAAKIRKLMVSKYQVADKEGGLRDIRYSDIVILLRSAGTAQIFADELKNHDIPAFSGSDTDYFLASEVMLILALLQIIDNPRQDIPLIAALHSAIFRFSADDLAEIRHTSRKGDFYSALTTFAATDANLPLKEKVLDFLNKLEKWRNEADFLGVSQLIYHLYQETGFFDYVGILPGGKLRRANLLLLFEKAAKYEQSSYRGLFNFIRYIEKLQKNNYGFEKANISSENDDLVRIMTIHRSKGLEFPVVFVCNLGKRFNLRDSAKDFVVDYDLGMGIQAVDLDAGVKSNTFSRWVIGRKITQAQISEEMRILYVAMTRAKERLFLVGSTRGKMAAKEPGERVTPYDVSRARSFLDWILLTVGDLKLTESFSICISDKSEYELAEAKKWAKVERTATLSLPKPGENHSGQWDLVLSRLSYSYPHPAGIYAPAKMSVSEVKRLFYREFLADSTEYAPPPRRDFAPPRFLQHKAGVSAATKGIVVHTVLEHLDFNTSNADAVIALVHRLVEKKLIKPDEAEIVPVTAIVRFLSSEIVTRMRKSAKVEREIPFSVSVPPILINSSFEAAGHGEILLHGVVDCVFEEGDGIVIVDYKTEKVVGDLTVAAEAYRPQLELYQYALERILGRTVKQRVIYFFDVNSEIAI